METVLPYSTIIQWRSETALLTLFWRLGKEFSPFEAREDSLKKASLEISNQSDKLTRKKLKIRKGIFTPSVRRKKKNPEIHKHTDIHELIQSMERTKNGINSDFCSLSNRPNRWFLSAPFGFLLFAFGVTATHTQTNSQDKTLRMDVVDPAYNESHRRLMMAWQIVLFRYRLLRIASTNIFLWLVKHNSTRTSFSIENNHMSNLLPLFRYLFNNREVTCKSTIPLWKPCPWNSFFEEKFTFFVGNFLLILIVWVDDWWRFEGRASIPVLL